ncbi:UNVERIFIED_CONTAM: Chloride channel protein CLC-f [Sesamum angustifolium]|uniref:Chloride channel protein CLC-f n=1 Tax=Sesamum angustifolium TaxID=2727405 RepID=A0AAW2KUZ0_9LAMI
MKFATGKTASAPGIWLLAQLSAAESFVCYCSIYLGAVLESLLILLFQGNAAIAAYRLYALVGMAATLASVCSVPLTSVLLLFELTKDYQDLAYSSWPKSFLCKLDLRIAASKWSSDMVTNSSKSGGAVGLAIWVPSVTTPAKETEVSDTKSTARGYHVVSPVEGENEGIWRQTGERDDIELSLICTSSNYQPTDIDILLETMKVAQAMSNNYLKVSLTQTVREALNIMRDGQQHCVLVVDAEDSLEGILTHGDIRRCLSQRSSDASVSESGDVNTRTVSSIFTRGINYRGRERGLLICYPDTDLAMAKQLMEAKGIKQLPVIKRAEDAQRERKRRVVAILYYDSIWSCLRDELNHQKSVNPQEEDDPVKMTTNGHQ